MARPVYKYQPINNTPDVAIGVSLPFNNSSKRRSIESHYTSSSLDGASVFNLTYTTEEQVISNLKNLLLTRKGERYMQPNFGTNIYSILFENNTEDMKAVLKNSITKDIEYWLPYITINDIKLTTSTDGHSITILLKFQITNIGTNLVINIIASENTFQISDAELDTTLELRQISNGY
jgi:uncharacterized protein